MKRPLHLVFAGGGTAGHLFPGLAVAESLAAVIRRLRITFAGGGKESEQRLWRRPDSIITPCPAGRFHAARARPSRSSWKTSSAIWPPRRFLKEEQVDAVVGLGGYASVPMGRAAAGRRIPLVLLEQNVLPGRATRWLAPKATLLCTSFPQTQSKLRYRCPLRVTGNPIRRIRPSLGNFRGWTAASSTQDRPRQLLVLGGSRGARSLNENVPRAIYKAADRLAGWQIVHQSGEADLSATRQLYQKSRRQRGRLSVPGRSARRAGGKRLGGLPGGWHHVGRTRRRRPARDPAPVSPGRRRPSAQECRRVCPGRRCDAAGRTRSAGPARRPSGRRPWPRWPPASDRRAAWPRPCTGWPGPGPRPTSPPWSGRC